MHMLDDPSPFWTREQLEAYVSECDDLLKGKPKDAAFIRNRRKEAKDYLKGQVGEEIGG